MTFSIVAQDGDSFGVAVASKFPFVGAVVPDARLGLGAVATQAMARVSYRDTALEALSAGADAATAIEACTGPDDERDHRQLGVVGRDSQATWTGPSCLPWAGGVSGRDESGAYAIQGNILVGPEVVEAMERAWLASAGRPFTDRLVAALLAGDDAGGDSRGRQGAALYAVRPGAGYDQYGLLADVRVDDHPDAPRELARLVGLNDLLFGSPEDVQPLEGALADEVLARLESIGFSGGSAAEALAAWASEENYETRLSPDGIDAKVLGALRAETDEDRLEGFGDDEHAEDEAEDHLDEEE
ncbi:DUF1028 domain-containing protein [Phycicoccus sp. 3266]|uniref:DUF1028 domain-containing protein n=1 Tax=Phycicoccus sp. 3266 TaxID=2817751 RepID=UPI0028677792|nr:DUF1028 domain-containing protein [Phycicoccus sp. 3266]MDR6862744.1 putative Ntn-hydrolase superfamily protein [Phycicoccus sp. 3266]